MTCETVAAIVLHVRPVDWDTQQPVAIEHVTCLNCRPLLAAELGLVVAAGTPAAAVTVGPASNAAAEVDLDVEELLGPAPLQPRVARARIAGSRHRRRPAVLSGSGGGGRRTD